jgi:hypothetical protein
MAAPHVAGAAAAIWGANLSATSSSIQSLTLAAVTPDKLTNVPDGTPNLLLYVPAGNGVAPSRPLNVTAVGGPGRATVTWQAPTDSGSSAITVYTVTSNPDNKRCYWSTGALSCKVLGLRSNVTYSFTVVDGAGTPLATQPSWLSLNASTRTFTGTPASGDTGLLRVRVTASDGSLSVSDIFDINVVNPNVAPVANPTMVNSLAQQSVPTVTITDNLAGNATVAGQTVTYTLKFSEAIDEASLTAADVVVTNGGTKGALTKVSDTEYTISVTAPSGNGLTSLRIADGSYTSAAGVAGQGNSATQGYGVQGSSSGAGVASATQMTFTDRSMATLPDGGWVTASYKPDRTSASLTRFDAAGNQVGQTTYTTHPTGNPLALNVVGLANGDFILVEANDNNVYGQRYTSNLTASGGLFNVNATALQRGAFASVSVTDTMDGGFVIAWENTITSPSIAADIYAQRFDATGQKIGSEFSINTISAGDQQHVSIDGLNGGGFIAVWCDNSGTSRNVMFQKFNADGTPNGVATAVASVASPTFNFNTVVRVFNDDSFIVAWNTQGTTGTDQTKFQRFSAAGMPIGSAVDVAVGVETDPDIAVLAGGGFVMTWLTNYNSATGGYEAVVVQTYDAAGNAAGTPSTISGRASTPHVTALSSGGFALSYTDNTLAWPNFSVVNKVFAAPGGSFLSGATAGATDSFVGGVSGRVSACVTGSATRVARRTPRSFETG